MFHLQLEDGGSNSNMKPLNKRKKYSKQASFSDYTHQTDYDRGHIFPSAHAHHKSDKEATFTLTNIVPQSRTFNNGSWKSMEKCVRCVMHEYCLNQNNQHEAFVVTGAIPNANKTLKNKVNIPKTLWTAFCCYSKVLHKWFACAHWGANVKGRLEAKTVADLNLSLGVDPFPDKCLHTTDSELRTVFSSRPISPSSKTHVRKKAGKRPPKL